LNINLFLALKWVLNLPVILAMHASSLF
jgi:hypothetical protein